MGIAEFAAALRRGDTTSEAATQAYLDRIAEQQPRLGAFRRVRGVQALTEARALDAERAAGHDRGPLMGVPIAIKEIIAIDGMGCSVNSALDVRDLLPTEGPFVRALRAAGCVILGTTVSTEFAVATLNWERSTPWNPVDASTRRLCGGSSHGSAVAVAAGLCALAVGTDTGGSVRVPAALCGVAGFKGTKGLWPMDGIFPAAPAFDSLGLLAPTAADCAMAAQALSPGLKVPQVSLKGLRMGLLMPVDGDVDDAPVRDAMAEAERRLSEAGVEVVPLEPWATEEAGLLLSRLLPAQFARVLGRERLLAGLGALDPVTASRATAEIDMDIRELRTLLQDVAKLQLLADARMAGFDAWCCATTPMHASPWSELRLLKDALAWNRRVGKWTRPVNVFGQCAISLPLTKPGGTPAGIQLICGRGQDARLLAIAQSLSSFI